MVRNTNRNDQPARRVPSSIVIDHSIALRKSGLIIWSPISFHRWEEAGRRLISFAESTAWWIGDWLVYGESSFHDRYREAVGRTSLSYQTLRNYTWVARRFDLSRRRDNLSFGHHAEVAALDVPEQDYWLRKAEELGWSRNQLRNNVRASLKERRGIAGKFDYPPAVQQIPQEESGTRWNATGEIGACQVDTEVMLRITSEQAAQFAAVANEQGLSVDEWAVHVLEAAAAGKAR